MVVVQVRRYAGSASRCSSSRRRRVQALRSLADKLASARRRALAVWPIFLAAPAGAYSCRLRAARRRGGGCASRVSDGISMHVHLRLCTRSCAHAHIQLYAHTHTTHTHGLTWAHAPSGSSSAPSVTTRSLGGTSWSTVSDLDFEQPWFPLPPSLFLSFSLSFSPSLLLSFSPSSLLSFSPLSLPCSLIRAPTEGERARANEHARACTRAPSPTGHLQTLYGGALRMCACMRACVRVRACVHACVRACVCVRTCIHVFSLIQYKYVYTYKHMSKTYTLI